MLLKSMTFMVAIETSMLSSLFMITITNIMLDPFLDLVLIITMPSLVFNPNQFYGSKLHGLCFTILFNGASVEKMILQFCFNCGTEMTFLLPLSVRLMEYSLKPRIVAISWYLYISRVVSSKMGNHNWTIDHIGAKF